MLGARCCGACCWYPRLALPIRGGPRRWNASSFATRCTANLPGRFEATGGQLFGRIWWIWLLGLMPFLLFAGGLAAILVMDGIKPQPSAASHPPVAAIVAMLLGTPPLIALPFLHAIRRAREWAWWAGGIRFDSVTVRCDLRSGSLIGVYWALIGFSALVFFAFAAVAGG